MTSNLAKVYNWITRGLRSLPLIAIVEDMLYGVIKYYQKRHATSVLHSTTVSAKMYRHLNKAVTKAENHLAVPMGLDEHHFQVTMRTKGGVGQDTVLVTHDVKLGFEFNG